MFNPRITQFDSNFFLSFDHSTARKASYAASFGFELKDLSQKEQDFIGQHLPNLQHLSIREKQGAAIVDTLTKQPCQVHIDPSLLLTQKEWEEIAVKPARIKEPYVLLYMVPKETQLTEFAIKLAKEKKCKLWLISGGFDLKNRVPVPHITPSVAEWVGLFLHAQYVVTNSFHGLAFSINFKRPFFLGSSPKNWPAQSRKTNLLELVGLQHRVYTNFTKNFDETIDWNSVHALLDDKRKQAFDYLHQITQ